jgi:hypothetical protein
VRGGDSPEVIAAETGWALDRVLRYAEPMLAERSFIAEQAQGVEVRRSGGGATLKESAYQAAGIDPEAGVIVWDAWRREDGRWIVGASYTDSSGSHAARWTYDHVGRNLHPIDDEARTLMGARPLPVPDAEIDIAEALDLIADIPVVREDAVEVRPHLVAVPDAVDDDVEDVEIVEVEVLVDEVPERIDTDLFGEPRTTTPAASEPAPAPAAKAPARKARPRKGRASVPSWDEILFGAKTDE